MSNLFLIKTIIERRHIAALILRLICFISVSCFTWSVAVAAECPSAKALPIAPPLAYESSMSILVIEARNGNVVYQHNKDVPRLIASNMKLFTTLIGLSVLGADYHWHTKLYYDGEITKQHELNGNLYFVGGGDPTLDTRALYRIFGRLKQAGIRKINGDIILNDGIFDSKPTYSMNHYRDYDNDTVLPNGILIDANLTHVYIDKKGKLTSKKAAKNNLGHQFVVRSDLYKYKVVERLQMDEKSPQCQHVYDNLNLKLVGNNLVVSGNLGLECDKLDLTFNFLPVFSYNKLKIQQILDHFGIKFKGRYLLQPANTPFNQSINQQWQLLYDYPSASLEEILINMNHFSNNLIAETVLLTSGTLAYPGLSSYIAEQKLFNEFIVKNHLSNPRAKVENGAGLSRYEYFTSQNLVDLLAIANSSPQHVNFEASLPVPGQEGTLKYILLPLGNNLHAKTGTLDDVKSLSGYFYSHSGKKYIFSVVVNDFDTRNSDNIHLLNGWIEALLQSLD